MNAPVDPSNQTVIPHLVCSDASAAIDFYKRAFGAIERHRLAGPGGKGVMHACISIGNSCIFLVDENPQWGSCGPKALKGTPVTIHLQVPDVDQLFRQAIEAGGTIKMSPAEMFWGDRYGVLIDPFGHQWSIATHVKSLTPDQIAENARAFFASPSCA